MTRIEDKALAKNELVEGGKDEQLPPSGGIVERLTGERGRLFIGETVLEWRKGQWRTLVNESTDEEDNRASVRQWGVH